MSRHKENNYRKEITICIQSLNGHCKQQSLLFICRSLALTSLLTSSSTGGMDARGNSCSWSLLRSCDVMLATSRASLMRIDSARRMKEANRFMWMLFLMQCSFLMRGSRKEQKHWYKPLQPLQPLQPLFPLCALFDVESTVVAISWDLYEKPDYLKNMRIPSASTRATRDKEYPTVYMIRMWP